MTTKLDELFQSMRTKCLRFSRIVGYYSPVSTWNPGKVAEYKDRKMFNVNNPKSSNGKK